MPFLKGRYKIERAEKEGATFGPTHGSRRRHRASRDIVGKRGENLK
jgi:hypothetical protein